MPGIPDKPSNEAGSATKDVQFPISLRDFYSLAITQAGDAARSYSSTLEARRSGADVETAVRLDIYQTDQETVEALRAFFLGLVSAHPKEEAVTLGFMHATLDALEHLHASTTAAAALEAYQELLAAKAAATAAITISSTTAAEKPTKDYVSPFVVTSIDDKVVLTITGSPTLAAPAPSAGGRGNVVDTGSYSARAEAAAADTAVTSRFYAHVMTLLDNLRDSSRRGHGSTSPAPAELIAIGLATQFIREGYQLPRLFTPLSPPGWNASYQSFVFVTDAGADHIKITVQDPELLARGIVVHVEHIDRR